MSFRRFAGLALLAAVLAAGLLLLAGNLGWSGVAIVAVAEALAVAGLLRASRLPPT
jgi:hypothetical protein